MCMFLDADRRVDVETTNPDGFNFREKVKESGATVIGIQLDPEKGHDVSPQGLASLIAQNLAAGKGKDKEPLTAIQAALVGLALDPQENAKANNFIAALNDHAMQLGDAGNYERAMKVMQLGLDLLPADDTLVNNADVLWSRYAVHEVKAGRGKEAVAVVRRATELGQLKRPDDALAAPFIAVADDLCDAKKWSQAVAVLDQGLQALEGDSAAGLRKWLVQVHTRWAESERKRGDHDAAIAALSALMKRSGEDGEAKSAIEYFAQESLAEVERAGGPDAAAKLLARLRAEFASVEYLNEAGVLCARRSLEKLLNAKRFADAAAAVDRYKPLLPAAAARDEVGGFVVDSWGRELVRKQDWQQAVKVYADGLQLYPTSDLLKNNVVVAWDSWAGVSVKKKDWREAIRIYELALAAVGESAHLQRNLEICRKKAK